jgi:hypothetical protein
MPTAPSSTEWSLDPTAIRRRAKSVPGVQALPSPADHIVSFLVGLNAQQSTDGLARVNIFVDTGTVATCRVFYGVPRETFRRNVTSLDVVERLLRHPPAPTEIDETLVGVSDKEVRPQAHNNNNNKTTCLKDDIELSEVGLCILHGEKEKLETHLAALEEREQQAKLQQNRRTSNNPQRAATTSNSKSREEDSTTTQDEDEEDEPSEEGMEFQFSLPVSAMKHVEQCLQDISRMNKLVRGVATNGKGTIFLYGNGGVAYTPNIPKHLYQKLKLLRNSPISARPSYVSLGTRDRYFVAFKDDMFDWKGPKQLDKVLKGCQQAPRSVAFGNSYDTFFVVFADGSWKFHGRSIPSALADKLGERRDKADLVCVNLGPNGEWFVRAENGRMWWGGISEDLDAVTQDILRQGNFLHFIDFGEDGSYFLSHDA